MHVSIENIPFVRQLHDTPLQIDPERFFQPELSRFGTNLHMSKPLASREKPWLLRSVVIIQIPRYLNYIQWFYRLEFPCVCMCVCMTLIGKKVFENLQAEILKEKRKPKITNCPRVEGGLRAPLSTRHRCVCVCVCVCVFVFRRII